MSARADVSNADFDTLTKDPCPLREYGINHLGCTDALAYDPSDDTLWAGRDGGHSVATVEHYTTQGTLLSSANVGGLVNDRAGLAFAGSRVYMASPWSGFPKHIWQTTRSFSSANVIMTWTGGAKVEDLECDGTTFSTPVIWVQWNHRNLLQAYAVGGTCGPPAGAEMTVAQLPSATSITADSAVSLTSTVTDLGPLDALNTVASISLPQSALFGSATPSQGSCSSQPPVSCSLGTIAAGGSATVTYSYVPLAPGSAVSSISASSAGTISPALDAATVAVVSQPGTAYTSVTDSGFSPTATAAVLGGSVQWNFLGPNLHSASDGSGLGLFDTGPIAPVAYTTTRFAEAGKFPVVDGSSSHTGVVAVKVAVPLAASLTSSFVVQWASDPLPYGLVEDVQVKRPGQTAWTMFQLGQTAESAPFTPDAGAGTYQFRARLRSPATGKGTSYSTAKSVKVT